MAPRIRRLTTLVIVAGVGIPVSLHAGGNDVVVPAAPPAVPYSFGGVTTTWLPTAMAHDSDIASQSRMYGILNGLPETPPMSFRARVFNLQPDNLNAAASRFKLPVPVAEPTVVQPRLVASR